MELKDSYSETFSEFFEKISAQNNSGEIINFLKTYTVEEYLKFILNKIYLISFTHNDDDLKMWNYYGQSGFQFSINYDKLIEALSNSTSGMDLFITGDVKYDNIESVYNDNNKESIKFWNLINKNNQNYIDEIEGLKSKYDNGTFDSYLETIIISYWYSIKNTFNSICNLKEKNEIFDFILKDTFERFSAYKFKINLLLKFVAYSVLCKDSAYKEENEFRIAFLQLEGNQIENFDVRTINNSKFIYPFIEFGDKGNFLSECIEKIKISPATSNLPLSNYSETIQRFIEKNNFNNTEVEVSKKNIRW